MSVQNINDKEVNVLNESKTAIVKYYASWCGSCRLFAPKFKKLSESESFSSFDFLEVDAETNPETRQRAEVNNLPYFAIFKNGKFINGLSTAKEEALEKFIMENS
jgi:thioredoxin 1